MTCTSIVWKQFQNWIQITKNFGNHFQIPKDFQNSFLIQNGIRKNTKWFQVVDRLLGSPRPWLKGYLLKKWPMIQQASDYRIQIFWKFPDLNCNAKLISKNFCNPKIILKNFVIPIQFWNWFQTIEVQVIRDRWRTNANLYF